VTSSSIVVVYVIIIIIIIIIDTFIKRHKCLGYRGADDRYEDVVIELANSDGSDAT